MSQNYIYIYYRAYHTQKVTYLANEGQSGSYNWDRASVQAFVILGRLQRLSEKSQIKREGEREERSGYNENHMLNKVDQNLACGKAEKSEDLLVSCGSDPS